MASRRRETYILAITTLVSCVGSFGLTLALTSFPGIHSTASGNAGQAYGAAAATTSVVVLVYIARTFRHQSEESRMHREVLEAQTAELCLQREAGQSQHNTVRRSAEAAVRARHIKLLEMAMDDPLLMQCWPDYGPDTSHNCRKQYMYCNLIISHHCMCYELGYFTDEEVEASLYHIFGNEIVRSFWEKTRAPRGRTAPHGGLMRKFYDMTELAYLRRVDGDGVT
ncbi:DUF6082 family protein [Streptomyces sp. RP5T]|uniref:DUF6082 family protein n=1 Tax=Streptomyces sp. RP5T TaxID=2490848 RepID=UPI001C8BC608